MRKDGIRILYNGKQWGESKTFFVGVMAFVSSVVFMLFCFFGALVVAGFLSKVLSLFFLFGWDLWVF